VLCQSGKKFSPRLCHWPVAVHGQWVNKLASPSTSERRVTHFLHIDTPAPDI
jgi:hypothetical protein